MLLTRRHFFSELFNTMEQSGRYMDDEAIKRMRECADTQLAKLNPKP